MQTKIWWKAYICIFIWASLVALMVKNRTAMQKSQVQFLGQEDIPEKRVATHSTILAWRIPMDRGTWWLQSMGSQRVWHDWVTKHQRTAYEPQGSQHFPGISGRSCWIYFCSGPEQGSWAWSLPCSVFTPSIPGTLILQTNRDNTTSWPHQWEFRLCESKSHFYLFLSFGFLICRWE